MDNKDKYENFLTMMIVTLGSFLIYSAVSLGAANIAVMIFYFHDTWNTIGQIYFRYFMSGVGVWIITLPIILGVVYSNLMGR